MTKAQIELPPKLIPVFAGKYRYRGAYGGRGSGKSVTFHKMAVVQGYTRPMRILCAREFQNSLKESSFAEVAKAIRSEPWLNAAYEIGINYIRGHNGTEFIFMGLARNIESVKSLADIDICLVEEAEQVTEDSWLVLIPTIRKEGSEIWPIWNRRLRGSATDSRFIIDPPDDSCIVELNYRDNPWFPTELDAERLQDKEKRPGTYSHIWGGGYLESSETHPFMDYSIHPIPELDPVAYAKWAAGLYRVVSIDHSQCVGRDYFVIAEQGRDAYGKTYLLDLYRTNTADITERLKQSARFIRKRRPERLVIEDTSESRTFIDVLKLHFRDNDISMTITTPTASSRGSKEPYIVNWLEPLLDDGLYYAKQDACDIIHQELYSFDITKKDNLDDILDTLASGIRYLITPKVEKQVQAFKMTGIKGLDDQRKKLNRALKGKKVK